MTRTIAILGGDTRQLALVSYLQKAGLAVRCYGLPIENEMASWQEAVKDAAAVILPLPASPDGRFVHQPLVREKEAPLLSDLLAAMPKEVPIFGGKCGSTVKKKAESAEIRLIDYFESEEFQQKNALPTAEGAVSILMRESQRTVKGLPVVVTGYGRVAKALTKLLVAMEAKVTVIARNSDAVRAATAKGALGIQLKDEASVKQAIAGQAAVFNTVPCRLFSADILESMEKNILIIDLASAPGGVDSEAANALGIKVIWALSLPGKYAPQTAGEIIGETLLTALQKEGIL